MRSGFWGLYWRDGKGEVEGQKKETEEREGEGGDSRQEGMKGGGEGIGRENLKKQEDLRRRKKNKRERK